jgi:hypothetical protein
LLVGLAETCTEFENDEEYQVDDVGPFATVSISSDPERDGTDGSEHKHEGNTPGDVGSRLVECGGEIRHGKRDSEEVEGILFGVSFLSRWYHTRKTYPSPSTKSHTEEQPLLEVELRKKREGVGKRRHGRFEGRDARGQVSACTHMRLGIVILITAWDA